MMHEIDQAVDSEAGAESEDFDLNGLSRLNRLATRLERASTPTRTNSILVAVRTCSRHSDCGCVYLIVRYF